MMRTDRAGDLRSTDIDRDVVVCGWVDSRRDHGGVVFLDVRDVAGIVQVVVDPEQEVGADVHRVRNEYVVRVEGTVRHRPEGTVNDTLPTGEVEVAATVLEVLNESETPPFPVDDRIEADEMLRLRHRYVDLRRPRSAAQPAGARPGERRAAPIARRPGLHRGRDARCSSRRRPRVRATSWCPRACRPASSTRCRRARSCSSSCSWSAAWTATTRSPAACATKTCVPTASSSSCSSTPR